MVGDIEDPKQTGRSHLSRKQLEQRKQHVIKQVKTIDAIHRLTSGHTSWIKKDRQKPNTDHEGE